MLSVLKDTRRRRSAVGPREKISDFLGSVSWDEAFVIAISE